MIYTESLMQRGIQQYANKDVCILGGGDGALLYELLKESPRYVSMLEIDEMVMQACNVHLRSICGDVLETRKGKNYDVSLRWPSGLYALVLQCSGLAFPFSDHRRRL